MKWISRGSLAANFSRLYCCSTISVHKACRNNGGGVFFSLARSACFFIAGPRFKKVAFLWQILSDVTGGLINFQNRYAIFRILYCNLDYHLAKPTTMHAYLVGDWTVLLPTQSPPEDAPPDLSKTQRSHNIFGGRYIRDVISVCKHLGNSGVRNAVRCRVSLLHTTHESATTPYPGISNFLSNQQNLLGSAGVRDAVRCSVSLLHPTHESARKQNLVRF